MASFLSNFFAKPHSGAGLSIDESAVRYLLLRGGPRACEVAQHALEPLSLGTIVRGGVRDPERFAAVLAGLREYVPQEPVRVSLPAEAGQILEIPVHAEDASFEEQIASALERKLGLRPEEFVFDASPAVVLPGGSILASVSVFSRPLLERFRDILRAAGFNVHSFELAPVSCARAAGDGAHAIVMVEGTHTVFSVFDGRRVRYAGLVDVGERDLVEQLMNTLGVSPEEARVLLREEGEELRRRAKDLLAQAYGALMDGVRRHAVRFHALQSAGETPLRISRGILLGESADIPELPAWLERGMGVPIERANVWMKVCDFGRYIPPITRDRSFGYAAAIGAALQTIVRE